MTLKPIFPAVPRLSVNLNKVATLRNARGGALPDVIRAAKACIDAGAGGLTVHPRADGRHIRFEDVRVLDNALADDFARDIEFNIEGDPRPDWLDLVCAIKPAQATLVPVRPGEITSEAGWHSSSDGHELERHIQRLQTVGSRVSLFIDAKESAVQWAKACGADCVELYTEPFARAYERGAQSAQESLAQFVRAAELAHALGMRVNAGHDLDEHNLELFRRVPYLDEVSIGHAIWSEALFDGIGEIIGRYLRVLGKSGS